MVGVKLASKLATIKWQKKLQFTITQYNTEQNNIIQIFEVSLMPIMAECITVNVKKPYNILGKKNIEH